MDEEEIIQKSLTSFKLCNEYFAVKTERIRHLLELTEPTKIPLSKDYMMGVINYHGTMIPVVDLRMMLGFPQPEEELPEASIVVVAINDEGGVENLLGFKVDEVDQVFDYADEQRKNEVIFQVDPQAQKALNGTVNFDNRFIYVLSTVELSKVVES